MTEVEQFNGIIRYITYWRDKGHEGGYIYSAPKRKLPCDICGELVRKNISQRKGLCKGCNKVRKFLGKEVFI